MLEKLFGIKITTISRDEAAQEILSRPVTIQYRPTIVEFDRKVNEVNNLNDPTLPIDSLLDPTTN